MRTPYLPPEPLPDEDWLADDPLLRRLLAERLPARSWAALEPRLARLGRAAPREVDPLARLADASPPVLAGEGIAFHPAYARLQALARRHRVFTDAWHGGTRLSSLALGYLYSQAECGYFCPACMTDGAAVVLARRPGFEDVVARLVRDEPEGALEGAMFLTETTGGSDVGTTSTTAAPRGDGWALTGDKWFCSNANAGAILTLARMPGGEPGTRGLGLFLLEQPNPGLRFVRLKDKLGVRSMATGEGELRGAPARLVAGAGEGFKAMAEMVNLSRLYNAVASVAIARRALREGQKNGAWRVAFGRRLQDHPLYARAVAALAVDVKGALLVTLDAAHAHDRGDHALVRALTPPAKAVTARLAVRAASEACEMLGGNGYVQPWVTERLLRDAQVLPIWEGTTNVQALDFLRACRREGAVETLVRAATGLRDAWRAWAEQARAMDEASSLRLMTQAFHLRAATLLRDHDLLAAEAYALRHVARDEEAFERLAAREGAALAGWPSIGPREL
ncbi:MAG TPA: acyl-CoA dehydrogenase family protein [Candidatus Thermoplasmatota archaeon]|nr:acyl-CoA dehydrogenase family protein [Candidatus Thermoplasmatota archaeon]